MGRTKESILASTRYVYIRNPQLSIQTLILQSVMADAVQSAFASSGGHLSPVRWYLLVDLSVTLNFLSDASDI